MSRRAKFYVFDHVGGLLGYRDAAKDATTLAKCQARLSGRFAEVLKCPGGKQKRFYADGRVRKVKRAKA